MRLTSRPTLWLGLALVAGCLSGTYTLADVDITFSGYAADDMNGWSVLAAGDISGDGIDDMITTAPSVSGDRVGVYLGPIPGGALPAAPDIVFTGPVGSESGWSVATGDVSGNGFPDLIIGAPSTAAGGDIYILEGPLSAGSYTPADADIVLSGGASYDGYTLATGDFDGDGQADLASGNCGGDVYLVPGPLTVPALSPLVLDLPTAAVSHLTGDPMARYGCVVANGGDIYGTGRDALLVGEPAGFWTDSTGTTWTGAGVAYVHDAPSQGTVEGTTDAVARIGGVADAQLAATSLAGDGDFDADGFADILIGAPASFCRFQSDLGRPPCAVGSADQGSVGMFLGGALVGDYDLTDADLFIPSTTRDGMFGEAVAWADPNDEYFYDIVVGAPGMNKAFLYYSNAGSPGAPMPTYSETSWAGGDGAVFQFEGSTQFLGKSVSGLSDIDNDSNRDLLFGAPGRLWFAQPTGTSGSAHVYLGEDTLTGSRYSTSPRP